MTLGIRLSYKESVGTKWYLTSIGSVFSFPWPNVDYVDSIKTVKSDCLSDWKVIEWSPSSFSMFSNLNEKYLSVVERSILQDDDGDGESTPAQILNFM